MVFEHVVAPAQPGKIPGFGGSAQCRGVGVVQIQVAGRDAATRETAPAIPGGEEAFEILPGAVPVHGKHGTDDGVG